MKTYVHQWSYLTEFLHWEMFQTKGVEKIKTHTLCAVFFVNMVQSDGPEMTT
jgi:hypothetical protein